MIRLDESGFAGGTLAIRCVYHSEQATLLDQIALRLNQRPRKTLGFQTPASKLQASVASTV